MQEQRKEETRGNSINKVIEGLRRKLEVEKDKEVRGILKMRKKIQNLKKYLDEGSGGAYRQVQRELLERYKKYCTEREGMVLGLERAIDLVEQAEGEQGQQAPPPRFSPHPGRPVSGRITEDQKSGGTPQNRQSTEDRAVASVNSGAFLGAHDMQA